MSQWASIIISQFFFIIFQAAINTVIAVTKNYIKLYEEISNSDWYRQTDNSTLIALRSLYSNLSKVVSHHLWLYSDYTLFQACVSLLSIGIALARGCCFLLRTALKNVGLLCSYLSTQNRLYPPKNYCLSENFFFSTSVKTSSF